MADAPSSGHNRQPLSHHGAYVQNVLFEDGRAQLLNTCEIGEVGDHIFQNHLGHVAPGIGAQDAVIVPSETAPMPLPLELDE
jgi:hypothetical protein